MGTNIQRNVWARFRHCSLVSISKSDPCLVNVKQFQPQGVTICRHYCSQLTPSEPKPTEWVRPRTNRGRTLSNFDITCLLKAKMYPNKEAIPELISHTTLHQARDWMRVRVVVWMMISTAFIYLGMRQWGLYDQSQGKFAGAMHMERINELRQQGIAEEQAAKASQSKS